MRADVDGLGSIMGKFAATQEMTELSLPVFPMMRSPLNVKFEGKWDGKKMSSMTGTWPKPLRGSEVVYAVRRSCHGTDSRSERVVMPRADLVAL